MRDCCGYGGIVRDICGDVGIVSVSDAAKGRGSVRPRCKTDIWGTSEERREENRPPDWVGRNSDRSLQKLYGFDCWDWGILMMTSLGLARPSSSRAMDSILWGSVLRDFTSSESSAFSFARRLMLDWTRSISCLVRRMAR